MIKYIKRLCVVFLFIALIYGLGPRHSSSTFDNRPLVRTIDIQSVQDSLDAHNKSIPNLKVGNEAEIVWAKDTGVQTDYCLVYLPGFGASKGEGEPLHRQIAAEYGLNLYLARLEKQGIEAAEPFIDLSESKLVESAKEAVRYGKSLGKKVILMSTSTGSTLALYLAAKDTDIAAIVAWSPNIDMADPLSNMLTMPWGLQLARLSMGGKYRSFEANDTVRKWWINRYRIEGLVCLKSLIQQTMTETTFEQIKQPVLMVFHYKNEVIKDKIVSIDKGKEAFLALGTPEHQKELKLMGNVSGHCMGSQYFSSAAELKELRIVTKDFLERHLNLVK